MCKPSIRWVGDVFIVIMVVVVLVVVVLVLLVCVFSAVEVFICDADSGGSGGNSSGSREGVGNQAAEVPISLAVAWERQGKCDKCQINGITA